MSRKIQGRVFTCSLKPAWSEIAIEEFVNSLTGTCVVHAITHNKDTDENGEVLEAHTHFLVEYETPRKLQTVANLFGVEPNFIEVVKSKKAMVRYLTHIDDPDKYHYEPELVITNSPVAYSDLVLGQNLSDRDIAQYIMEGRGVDLFGVVSASKLRTIQAFLTYDRQGKMFQQMREMNEKLNTTVEALGKILDIAEDFQLGIVKFGEKVVPELRKFGEDIKSVVTTTFKHIKHR